MRYNACYIETIINQELAVSLIYKKIWDFR